jgi:quercetin dioxygenase-like cupin family protein
MSGRPSQVRPGEKHWHGTNATTAMSHIAIHERLDGQAMTWLEAVSDDQYRGRVS